MTYAFDVDARLADSEARHRDLPCDDSVLAARQAARVAALAQEWEQVNGSAPAAMSAAIASRIAAWPA